MTWTKNIGKSIAVGVTQLAQSAVTEQPDQIMRAGVAAGSYIVATALPIEKIDLLGGSKEERALTDVIAASLIQATANRFVLESEMSFFGDSMMCLSSQILGVYVYDVFDQGSKMRSSSSVRAVLQ